MYVILYVVLGILPIPLWTPYPYIVIMLPTLRYIFHVIVNIDCSKGQA